MTDDRGRTGAAAEVPRETSTSDPSSVPAAATRLLGSDAARLQPLAELLAGPGVHQGLLGPREAERLWERHLLNSAAAVEGVPAGVDVIDVGSGAGLPGLVWALLRPDLRLVLVEPLLRRSTFLVEAVSVLGLTGVEVRRSRAEDLHGHLRAPVVTARAVAPLDRLAAWCLPLVRPGGELRALKGRRAWEEADALRLSLPRGDASDVRVATYGVGVLEPPATVVHVSVGTPDQGGRGE